MIDPQTINAIEGQLRSILERNDELRRYL